MSCLYCIDAIPKDPTTYLEEVILLRVAETVEVLAQAESRRDHDSNGLCDGQNLQKGKMLVSSNFESFVVPASR